jgi:hypothetical protein
MYTVHRSSDCPCISNHLRPQASDANTQRRRRLLLLLLPAPPGTFTTTGMSMILTPCNARTQTQSCMSMARRNASHRMVKEKRTKKLLGAMGKGGFCVHGLGSAPKRGKIAAFEHGNGQNRAKAVRALRAQ